jgi:4-aminobutyrate aminotransferase
VRGLGLMVATEFRTPDNKPDKNTSKAVIHASQERKLLLLSCGTYDNIIRWIPPLIVTEKQINDALSVFGEALKDTIK